MQLLHNFLTLSSTCNCLYSCMFYFHAFSVPYTVEPVYMVTVFGSQPHWSQIASTKVMQTTSVEQPPPYKGQSEQTHRLLSWAGSTVLHYSACLYMLHANLQLGQTPVSNFKECQLLPLLFVTQLLLPPPTQVQHRR